MLRYKSVALINLKNATSYPEKSLHLKKKIIGESNTHTVDVQHNVFLIQKLAVSWNTFSEALRQDGRRLN